MPLKLQVVAENPLESRSDVLVFGVFEAAEGKLTLPPGLDKPFGGAITSLASRDEFRGKRDTRLVFRTLGKLPAPTVVLVGLGPAASFGEPDARLFGAQAGKAALAEKATSLFVSVPDAAAAADLLRATAEGVILGAYRYTRYLTGERRPKRELGQVSLGLSTKGKPGAAEQRKAALGQAIGEAVAIARDLQNAPPNDLTPRALAEEAARVAKTSGLKAQVFDRKKLEQMGMKLFVAVGQGSANEPHMVHITYTPSKKPKKKLVFVGKGLTFDSGGLCIKPAQGMGEMKSDMSGAANVVGLMAAIARVKPDVELHGIIGCAENMPDGHSYRPGDIFGSLDGKTVEIINTDAEGRLVLADCLTYAKNLSPDLIVDNATLTGACVIALGPNCTGFYATADALADGFSKAAAHAGEQFWRMPLLEDLREQLKSDVADLKHTGERFGGSITAALFLREFVGDVPWIHCDIAGPALSSRAYGIYPKGGTGHGVLTFLRFIESHLA